MLKILNALPLLIIAVAIYFAGTYLALQQAVDTAGSFWHSNAFDLRLPSGTVWSYASGVTALPRLSVSC